MTFRSRICSSAAAAILLTGGAWAATVSGSVRIVDSKSADVSKRGNYSGVVVWLERADGSAVAAPAQSQVMEQRKKTFRPHILAVPVGSTVDFPNFDPIFHNAFSNFAGQPFDTGLYAPGTSYKITFRRSGIVRVFCNIHPTMSAVIAVLNSPYFEVTPAAGTFSIRGVAAGRYRLRVFHERASQSAMAALDRIVEVNGGDVALPPMSISEAGYVAEPHKNKHGRDYPAVVEDTPLYPRRRP